MIRGLWVFMLAALVGSGALAQSGKKEEFAVGQPVAPAKKPAAKPEQQKPPPPGVRDLSWEDLVPKDWNPRKVLDKLGLRKLDDNDPRANEILGQIRAEWDRAPVVAELDGQKVRLPGFVVMLEGDEKGVGEFLLVPYFGACIHVPPPPSNQLVHVFPEKLVPEKIAAFPVWVIGTLTTVHADTKMGSAGYRIKGARVEAYPWKQ